MVQMLIRFIPNFDAGMRIRFSVCLGMSEVCACH
jgi:hypothetical protein